MSKKINLTYESSLVDLEEVNSSFDKGILRVAYTGKNRNGSFISKEAFERSMYSIYNCPIVCNYIRESNSIGSHDVEIVDTDNGMKLVNITQPVGVIPESSNYWWEIIAEDNGVSHEYLCVDALIWKRQEAYTKIKENKITDESMEITVKSGKMIDDSYHIDSFEFTAFCLLESAEPCFESASLEVFSLNEFRESYTKMMNEFKEEFSKVTTSNEDDIYLKNTQNLSKGGKNSLNKTDILSEYGLTLESIDFNIDDYSIDELKYKLEKMKNESFSISNQQFMDELYTALSSIKYTDPEWGECGKYSYIDHDNELSEVYCYDCEDWKIYGFPYSMNGDHVVIDFECKKRKKCSFVDFDEGAPDVCYSKAFEDVKESIVNYKDAEINKVKSDADKKFNEASTKIDELNAEINALREFKNAKLGEERKASEEEIFGRFADLLGIEDFENLRTNCSDMTIEEIESKCYEIKGRNMTEKFSANKPSVVRVAVNANESSNEPYGGLFIEYPPSKN